MNLSLNALYESFETDLAPPFSQISHLDAADDLFMLFNNQILHFQPEFIIKLKGHST
jgi:hypothetical protein